MINLEFANKAFITWEGRSCNGKHIEGAPVGVEFYGESGTMLIDGSNAYKVFDLKGKLIKEVTNQVKVDARSLTNPSQALDAIHLQNFFAAIKSGTKLNADIESGHISTLLCQLGNIALRSGGSIQTNPENGRILNNKKAMKLWSRTYEKGWEPKV